MGSPLRRVSASLLRPLDTQEGHSSDPTTSGSTTASHSGEDLCSVLRSTLQTGCERKWIRGNGVFDEGGRTTSLFRPASSDVLSPGSCGGGDVEGHRSGWFSAPPVSVRSRTRPA